MLKKVIAEMLIEMFEFGLDTISRAKDMYDLGDDEVMPQYWDEYEFGNSLMDAAVDLGYKVGYITDQTVWEDEVEYR